MCSAGQCVDCSSLVTGCNTCVDGNSTAVAMCQMCGQGFDSTPSNGSCIDTTQMNTTNTSTTNTSTTNTSTTTTTTMSSNATQECIVGFTQWNSTSDSSCHQCSEMPHGMMGCASCNLANDGEVECLQCQLGYTNAMNKTFGNCVDCSVADPICITCAWVPSNTTVNTTTASSSNLTNSSSSSNSSTMNTSTIVSNVTSGSYQCLECPWPISFLHPDGHCVVIYAFDTYAQSVAYVNGSYVLECVPGYFVWADNTTGSQFCVSCSEGDQWSETCNYTDGEFYVETCYDGFYYDNETMNCAQCAIPYAATCQPDNLTGAIVALTCVDGFYLYNNTCYACSVEHVSKCEWRNQSFFDGEVAFWSAFNSTGEMENPMFFDVISFIDGEINSFNSSNTIASSNATLSNATMSNTTSAQWWAWLNTTDNGFVHITECAWSFFKFNNTCAPCKDVFSNCSFCAWNGDVRNLSNLACVECASGFYWNANTSTCSMCTNNSNAKSCFQNPYNSSELVISSCMDGFYLNDGQCAQCTSNCSICYGNVQQTASACLKCMPGFYLGADNLCHYCPYYNQTDAFYGSNNATLAGSAKFNFFNATSNMNTNVNSSTGAHSNYYNGEQFEDRWYNWNGKSFNDGEAWDGEIADAFYNFYTMNGTNNVFDGIHYNYTLNSYTNWAIINVTRSELRKITGQRNFVNCTVANLAPTCLSCNETLIGTFRMRPVSVLNTTVIIDSGSGATETNSTTTATNATTIINNTTNTNTTNTNTTNTNSTGTTTSTTAQGANTGNVCSQNISFCNSCNVQGVAVVCTKCQDGYYVASSNTCQPCTSILPNCAVCTTNDDLTVSCNNCFFGFTVSGNTCNRNTSSNDSSMIAFSLAILALLQVFLALA